MGFFPHNGYCEIQHDSRPMGQFTGSSALDAIDQDVLVELEGEPSLPAASEDEIDRIEDALLENLKEIETASDLYATDAFNILLIGVDSRSDSMNGRSDAIILVSINRKTKQVVMASFLRDIYLSIPGHGSNRINASYAFGGTELLKDTIKANFGISVDRCVVFNFFLVMDIVDAIGGIDLDVTADEIDAMNMYIHEHNQILGETEGKDMLSKDDTGTLHVNGDQALAYARVRYVGTDFARTSRQRTVISKCLDKVKTMGFGAFNELALKFIPRIQTDLNEEDCAALLLMSLDLDSYKFQSLTIPVDKSWNDARIKGMSILTIDFSKNAEAWHEMVEGEGSE